MKVEELKKLEPFQCSLILVLDRIARCLERMVEDTEENVKVYPVEPPKAIPVIKTDK